MFVQFPYTPSIMSCFDEKLGRPTILHIASAVDSKDALYLKKLAKSLCYQYHFIESVESLDIKLESTEAACIVCSINLPQDHVSELSSHIRNLASKHPSIVVLCDNCSNDHVVQMMQAGAASVMDTPCDPHHFQQQLSMASDFGRKIVQDKKRFLEISEHLELLAPEEEEILSLIIQGKMNKQIIIQLNISARTCDRRKQSILKKMGVENQAHLIKMVTEHELLRCYSNPNNTN